MRKSLAALALALGAISIAPGAASAYVAEPPTGVVSSGTIESGGSVTFSGSGFAPGSVITILLDGVVIDEVVADANGEFSYVVEGLEGEGTATLTAVGEDVNGEVITVAATVVVADDDDDDTPAAAPVRHVVRTGAGTAAAGSRSGSRTSASSLPRTGSDGTATQVWAGVGLLGLGGGLVALTVARRRESSAA